MLSAANVHPTFSHRRDEGGLTRGTTLTRAVDPAHTGNRPGSRRTTISTPKPGRNSVTRAGCSHTPLAFTDAATTRARRLSSDFHRVFSEGAVHFEYERPFGLRSGAEELKRVLNWGAEAKKKREVQTG